MGGTPPKGLVQQPRARFRWQRSRKREPVLRQDDVLHEARAESWFCVFIGFLGTLRLMSGGGRRGAAPDPAAHAEKPAAK